MLVTATVAAFVCAVPQAAVAAVPGLELVTIHGQRSSDPVRTTEGDCPAGKDVLSVGGRVPDGENQVKLDGLDPFTLAPVDVRVRASEDQDGVPTDWNVLAYAICASFNPGEKRSTLGPSNSLSPKSVSTLENGVCGQGRFAVGAGGEIRDAGPGQVQLEGIIPSEDLLSVTVRAAEDQDGTLANWRLRAMVVCAARLPGLERIVATSPSNSVHKHATATCTAGKRVVGVGGEILNGGGQVGMTYIMPDGANLTQVHARGSEDQDGTSANWAVRAYAICANP